MTEQTPEALSTQQENALICEKLLGWIRHTYPANESPAWEVPSKAGEFQPAVFVTPSFTTWADAGLILEAFAAGDVACDLYQDGEWSIGFYGKHTKCHTRASQTGPLAVRSAALAYIRSVP